MSEAVMNDKTEYMAVYSGPYHSSTVIKTRKAWFDLYCIDVKEKPSEFKLESKE